MVHKDSWFPHRAARIKHYRWIFCQRISFEKPSVLYIKCVKDACGQCLSHQVWTTGCSSAAFPSSPFEWVIMRRLSNPLWCHPVDYWRDNMKVKVGGFCLGRIGIARLGLTPQLNWQRSGAEAGGWCLGRQLATSVSKHLSLKAASDTTCCYYTCTTYLD